MNADSTYEDTARYAIDRYQPEYVVIYKSYAQILDESNASHCKQVMVYKASDYGSSQDLLIFQCNSKP